MQKYLSVLLIFLSLISCKKNNYPDLDFRQEMRNFVINLSLYSRTIDSNFIVIPQNGIELITNSGEVSDEINIEYLNAIDGHGQEDCFFGYNNDNEETPSEISDYLTSYLDISKNETNNILITDYCSDISKINNSYSKCNEKNYISYAATHRELDNIPEIPNPIYGENNSDIENLNQAKNFLYLINLVNFNSKKEFISSIQNTNYDLN